LPKVAEDIYPEPHHLLLAHFAANMATEPVPVTWSSQYQVAPESRATRSLPGDKILLPASALEQLLSAATVTTTVTDYSRTSYDPFNPYSLAAARNGRTEWRDTQQQLPHPLTFRLVNPKTGNVVHAGIREFSAADGEIGLSSFLRAALGLKENGSRSEAHTNGTAGTAEGPKDLTQTQETTTDEERIVVHAKQLPKGTYVRLRPLEAGYNPEDWKSLLERHLRDNYTTLTKGEILTVSGDRRTSTPEFRFLIDKFSPEGDGICVVDTDLEVDIEALNEEQARETVKQIMKRSQRAAGTPEGSSPGGKLDIWNAVEGQVLEGEYVDYELPSWDRSNALDIELTIDDGEEIDLFVSPCSARQRAKPRDDEHVFGEFSSERPTKRIRLQPTNVELEGAESLYISVHGYKGAPYDDNGEQTPSSNTPKPRRFTLRAKTADLTISTTDSSSTASEPQPHGPDEEQCKNCLQYVPSRTMMLHTNFCLRNNILCPKCHSVFKKSSPEWEGHWHCPHDTSHGNSTSSLHKHYTVFHPTTPLECPSCTPSHPEIVFKSLPLLAQHRTTTCPGKLILCQFCHLTVPQEGDPITGPGVEALISGLTPHELADGSRTTNCHLCNSIVRLRDMQAHLKHHELERLSKPEPRICRNALCGRTLDGVGAKGQVGTNTARGQGPGNDLGLCAICFGPLYVSMHDPDGKAMKRRIERRYLSQLMTGCGKAWCRNPYCRSGKAHLSGTDVPGLPTKEALPVVKPLVDSIPDLGKSMYFCVDEGSQKRRKVAEEWVKEGIWGLGWCVAALEACAGDEGRAREWLRDWAPRREERL
jgi:hypothetical protein